MFDVSFTIKAVDSEGNYRDNYGHFNVLSIYFHRVVNNSDVSIVRCIVTSLLVTGTNY